MSPMSNPIIVVMGVSGCGKSSVGRALAARLGFAFIEGDEHHPPANIARMSAGIPLTDEDRAGWLEVLAGFIAEADRKGEGLVLSCSALKRRYRDVLRGDSRRVVFLHLSGDKALFAERMKVRPGHFMPASLIDSQFAALEPPGPDEGALTVSVISQPDDIVTEFLGRLPDLLPGARPPTTTRAEEQA
ncbi:gluconokinase [Azospirillum sp. sgz302134]